MNSRKMIGGVLGAIIILIAAQILAQLVASLFVLVKIPEGICNIIAGIMYVGLAFVLLKSFSKKLLKIKMDNLGMDCNRKWFCLEQQNCSFTLEYCNYWWWFINKRKGRDLFMNMFL